MKTFAETRNVAPFDWNAFLAKDQFTEAEMIKALDLAGEWVTCACGNLCAALPRDADGEPLDCELAELGYEFNEAICSMEALHSWINTKEMIKWKDKARGILAAIEDRSAILLEPLVP